MTKSVFKVLFDEKWSGIGDLIPDSMNVIARDPLHAFRKVKAHRVGTRIKDVDRKRVCTSIHLTGVSLVASAQI